MRPTKRCVVELSGYPELGQSLLPAIRQAVRGLRLNETQQLHDIGLSRRGDKLCLHLYYTQSEEGV